VVVPVSVLTPVTSARASAHIGLPHASGPELAEKNREVASMRQWYQFRSIILIFLEGGFNDSLFIRGLRLGKTTAPLLGRASL